MLNFCISAPNKEDLYLESKYEYKCCFCRIFRKNKSYKIFKITHDVAVMAEKAGIYDCLWHPEKHRYKTAKDIIPILEKGLKDLDNHLFYFKEISDKNVHGSCYNLIEFVEQILRHCKSNPDHLISANR